jgi:alpha-L-fucosidase
VHFPLRPVLASVAALLAICFATGCTSIERAVERSVEDAPATTDRLAWWRAARFGMFVHWGLYAIPAGEWNGRTDYGEWIRANAQIPIDEYESFARHFDPQKFDADRWASLASEAGMKYMVVTTKHHDGFALFDSKVTDFDVMATPFHRDVMAEVATACRSHGLVPCWYHSIMDWHHPDYLPRREFETERSRDGAAFDRFEQYLRAQVTELLSNYGPIGVMWFDGEWEPTWTSERGQRLYDLCRSLQPNVIVNNRVGAGRAGMNGFAEGADTAGDFGTPEQQIPAAPRSGLDWESCLTMNDNWGYNAHDSNFKSTRQLIRTLVDVASKGGNLLLNVGPDANGEIPPKSVERLVGIGRWMKTNGSAIHGTLASPIDAPAGTRITYRLEGGDTRLFLHVFDWPADGHFVVNGLGNTAAGARLLADPARAIEVKSRPGATSFTIEGGASDPDVSVVELRLSGEPIAYASPTIEAESDLFLDSMLVTVGLPSRALEAHYTLDGSEPTRASAVARGPIAVTDSVALSARAFHGDLPIGDVVTRRLERVRASPRCDVGSLEPGLVMRTSTGPGVRLDSDWTADTGFSIVETVSIPLAVQGREHVRLDFAGFVRVERDDVYTFRLESDDGSRLVVDGRVLCENDGEHQPNAVLGSMALAAGWHSIGVQYFNAAGGATLDLRMGRPGAALARLGPEHFGHETRLR